MRWWITLVVAFVASQYPAGANASVLTNQFDLGVVNGHKLFAEVYTMHHKSALSRFALRFSERPVTSRTTVRTVVTPTNFVGTARFETGRLLGNGRKQLLVTLWNGRCDKTVYDWNGTSLRAVFNENDGRVDAHILHNEGRSDTLALYYPLNQWNSRLPGKWYYLPTFANMVTLLKWKDGEFLPEVKSKANPNNVLIQLDSPVECTAVDGLTSALYSCSISTGAQARRQLNGITKNALFDGMAYASALNTLAVLVTPLNRNVALYVYRCSGRLANRPVLRDVHQFHSYSPNEVYVVHDRIYLMSLGDNIVRIYDAKTFKETKTYTIRYDHHIGDEIEAMALNRSGDYIAILTKHFLSIQSLRTKRIAYRCACKLWQDPLVALSTRLHCAVVAHGNCCTIFYLDGKHSTATINTRRPLITDVQIAASGDYFATSCGPAIDVWPLRHHDKPKTIVMRRFRDGK